MSDATVENSALGVRFLDRSEIGLYTRQRTGVVRQFEFKKRLYSIILGLVLTTHRAARVLVKTWELLQQRRNKSKDKTC